MSDTFDQQSPELSLERAAEQERPLDPPLSETRVEKREVDASLELVREETAKTLESGTEFWRTNFGRENEGSAFRNRLSQERRRVLLLAQEVMTDRDAFADPDQLQKLLIRLRQEAQSTTGAATVGAVDAIDMSDGAEPESPAVDYQVAASAAGPESSAPPSAEREPDLEALQKELLELVHQLQFEQLFADMMQGRQTLEERSRTIATISEGAGKLPKEKLEEAVDLVQQYQIDRNVLEQYLAHGESMTRVTLRNDQLKDVATAQLRAIIEAYAQEAGRGTIDKDLQIAPDDRLADPATYIEAERTALIGGLTETDALQRALDVFQQALQKVEANPTQEQVLEVQAAAAGLVPGQEATAQPIVSSDAGQGGTAIQEVGSGDYQEFNS